MTTAVTQSPEFGLRASPVPDGLSWAGSATGRIWTARGDDLAYQGRLPSPDEVLAGKISDILGEGFQTYGFPPEVLKTPAVVVAPSEPYQTIESFTPGRGGPQLVTWNWNLRLLVPRGDPRWQFYNLSQIRQQITLGLGDGYVWSEASAPETVEVNEIQHLAQTVTVSAKVKEETVFDIQPV